MVLFILFSDIDKSYKSWYEWTPYGSAIKYTSNFVLELEKIGKVFIPRPSWVNFRKYATYDLNTGYDGDIHFTIEDLIYENYADWVYGQINEEDKHDKNLIIIGYEQGCHHAKFFANRFHDQCIGLFILGDRILTRENYEKVINKTYFDSLRDYFGDKWEKYTVDNLTNKRLAKLLGKLPNDNYVSYLNGFVKLKTRSQYDKIKNALVPAYIYTYDKNQTDETTILHRQFKEASPVPVQYNYLDDDTPYFIFGRHVDTILYQIKTILPLTGGKLKYYVNKSKYLSLKRQTVVTQEEMLNRIKNLTDKIMGHSIRIYKLPKYTHEIRNEVVKAVQKVVIDGSSDKEKVCKNILGLNQLFLKHKLKTDGVPIDNHTFTHKHVAEKLSAIFKSHQLTNSISIADVGGGDGDLIKYIGESMKITPDNLYCIEQESWTETYKFNQGVKYIFWDNVTINLPDSSIDIVLIVVSLHHMDDKTINQVLINVKRILKPSGLVFLKEHDSSPILKPLIDWEHHLYNMVSNIRNSDTNCDMYYDKYVDNYKSKQEFNKLFNIYGFKIVQEFDSRLHRSKNFKYFNSTNLYWIAYQKNN